jgi:hypothetical protein
MLDLEDYSNYYSIEKLYDDIFQKSINIEEIIILDYKTLFNLAIENGFGDVAEYLFVHKGVEFEVNNFAKDISISSNKSILENEVRVETGSINEGLDIHYLNDYDYKKKVVVERLLELRKYCTLRNRNCKFYYKFNKKYIPRVYQIYV